MQTRNPAGKISRVECSNQTEEAAVNRPRKEGGETEKKKERGWKGNVLESNLIPPDSTKSTTNLGELNPNHFFSIARRKELERRRARVGESRGFHRWLSSLVRFLGSRPVPSFLLAFCASPLSARLGFCGGPSSFLYGQARRRETTPGEGAST